MNFLKLQYSEADRLRHLAHIIDLTIDADLEDEDTNTSVNSINRSDLYSTQQHEVNGVTSNYGVDESIGR